MPSRKHDNCKNLAFCKDAALSPIDVEDYSHGFAGIIYNYRYYAIAYTGTLFEFLRPVKYGPHVAALRI